MPTKVAEFAVALALLAGSAACTDRDGPAENLGERIDDAASDARNRFEEVREDAREAADEIGDAVQDN